MPARPPAAELLSPGSRQAECRRDPGLVAMLLKKFYSWYLKFLNILEKKI